MSDIYFADISQRQTAAANTRASLLWKAFFSARVYSGYLFYRHFPAANCRRQYARFTFVESILFCPRLCRASILPTFPSGKLPPPIRALHFCGEHSFLPAFMSRIHFANISQRQTAAANTRASLLWRAFFSARVYSGYLFCRHFPAANCRCQYARFTFVESILFCPRLCRASILPTFPTPAVSKSRTVGFFIIKFCARVYVGYLFC